MDTTDALITRENLFILQLSAFLVQSILRALPLSSFPQRYPVPGRSLIGMPRERKPIDVDIPRWDQSSLSGRFRYFLAITDPRLCFASNESLFRAKSIVVANRYAVVDNDKLTQWQPVTISATDFVLHPQLLAMCSFSSGREERPQS